MITNALTDDTSKTRSSLQWRIQSIRHLEVKGFTSVAYDLKNCGCSFFIKVCSTHVDHDPKAVAKHCGLRICEDCEHRESYRKVLRYLPALNELLAFNPDLPQHRLRKLVLTTPYELKKLTSKSFGEKQKLVKQFLETYFYDCFLRNGELSKAEIRRGRCDLAKHGIGGIQAAEFGEKGKKLHWHILIYCPWLEKEKVWDTWEQVTGGECTNVDISPIKPSSSELELGGGDLLGAIKEIVKYSTKFTSLNPQDVPHLYEVLKGNRRFRAFGTLYNCTDGAEELEQICETCGAAQELTTISEYVRRCEALSVPIDDEVVDAVEGGIFLYLSREPEITVGRTDKPFHKARDSID